MEFTHFQVICLPLTLFLFSFLQYTMPAHTVLTLYTTRWYTSVFVAEWIYILGICINELLSFTSFGPLTNLKRRKQFKSLLLRVTQKGNINWVLVQCPSFSVLLQTEVREFQQPFWTMINWHMAIFVYSLPFSLSRLRFLQYFVELGKSGLISCHSEWSSNFD